ncbi:MAG: hypothetical protein ACOY2B_09835 [Pseudomonadota bacterium]
MKVRAHPLYHERDARSLSFNPLSIQRDKQRFDFAPLQRRRNRIGKNRVQRFAMRAVHGREYRSTPIKMQSFFDIIERAELNKVKWGGRGGSL